MRVEEACKKLNCHNKPCEVETCTCCLIPLETFFGNGVEFISSDKCSYVHMPKPKISFLKNGIITEIFYWASHWQAETAEKMNIDTASEVKEVLFSSDLPSPVSENQDQTLAVILRTIKSNEHRQIQDENTVNRLVETLLDIFKFVNSNHLDNLVNQTNKLIFSKEKQRNIEIANEIIMARSDYECYSLVRPNVWIVIENKDIFNVDVPNSKYQLFAEMIAVTQRCIRDGVNQPEIYGLRFIGTQLTIFYQEYNKDYYEQLKKGLPTTARLKIIRLENLEVSQTANDFLMENSRHREFFFNFLGNLAKQMI